MKNPYELWETYHIDNSHNLSFMVKRFGWDNPKTGGFDTETTGLHIKKDKPFLIQFGWLIPKSDRGRVFTFYPTRENMNVFFELASKLKYLVAHNTKYDLNMLSNIGYAEEVQAMHNLCENMVLARLTLEAVPTREGGDSLALKELGAKYVHPLAVLSAKMIDENLEKIRGENVKYLTAALKQFRYYDAVTKTGRPQMWNKGLIEKFLKDPTNDLEDLPRDVRDVWNEWYKEFPDPTYEDVDRDLMIKYGAEDIITMLEFFKMSYPILLAREQLPTLERENKAILPLYRMERVGIKTDRNYLKESRQRVKAYIIELRNEMYEIVGEKVTCNQHDRLKQIFKEQWGIILSSSDKQAMKNIIKIQEGKPNRLATLINKLRTLEKWYSTYILRIIRNSEYDGRGYTQINQASAVSGRVGSDFQQMPKKALTDLEGNELYHPRKPFIPTGGYYKRIYYCDWSQVELRKQANYTILVSGGDTNLCRAYIPFKCKHYKTGEIYNFEDINARLRWNELKEGHPNLKELKKGLEDAFNLGWSAWVVPETNETWKPTDVHAATTHKAFPHIPLDSEEFTDMRSKGKMFNFMRNYGGGAQTAMDALDISEEDANALVNGYSEAFPHVLIYQQQVQKQYRKQGYVTNMYGRRYYLKDSRKGYKLANYLVQGTCADMLKQSIIEIDSYLLDKKSRFQMNIHDENSIEVYEGEEYVIPEILKIMSNFNWCKIPIVADVEITTTNWAEKRGIYLEGN
jgi:DNA polymerase-1